MKSYYKENDRRNHMKLAKRQNLVALLLACVLVLSACGRKEPATNETPATPSVTATAAHEPITQELIDILDKQPEVKQLLQKSIDMAK